MVKIEDAVVARLKREGKLFEILVDCDKALAFRNGKVGIGEVIVTDDVFSDVKKGKHASLEDIKRIFGTEDKLEIAKKIILEGHVSLTAEHLRKQAEEKKKQVIDLIYRNAVDPNSGRPHPPQRIENAIAELKVRIDNNKPAEVQVQDVIKAIASILPIRYEVRTLMIKIPAQYAGKVFPILKQYGKLLGEGWEDDGSLSAKVEIPAGMQENLEIALNNLTKGNLDIKIIGKN